MKRILSIDWDFFIQEDPILDMGHRESMFFQEDMWAIREAQWAARGKTMKEMLPMEHDMMPEVGLFMLRNRFIPKSNCPVVTAESHQMIYEWVKRIAGKHKVEIINVDAHHDVIYGKLDELNCGNWAGHLFREGILKKFTVIYPHWRKQWPEPFEHPRELGCFDEINRIYWSDWKDKAKKQKIDGIYICRSGCWTPPCYDDRFNQFCEGFTGKKEAIPARILNQDEIDKMTKDMKEQFDIWKKRTK